MGNSWNSRGLFLFLTTLMVCFLLVSLIEGARSVLWALQYLCLFLMGPFVVGCRLYRIGFGRSPDLIAAIAIGAPLGLVAEGSVFFLSALAGWRHLIFLFPLIGAFLLANKRTRSELLLGSHLELGPALVLSLFSLWLVYLGGSYLFPHVLPLDHMISDRGGADQIYHLGALAEIRNHFPFQDPQIAGTPYQYHMLLWFHIVAASQVSFVPLDWIFTRLYLVPFCFIFVAQMFLLGSRILPKKLWGPVLALIFCIVMDHYLLGAWHTGNKFIRYLFTSATFLPGVIFTALFGLLVPELMREGKFKAGQMFMLSLAALGASLAKATVAPPILISLGLFFLWTTARARQLNWQIFYFGLILSLAFLFCYAVVYGGGAGTASIEIFTQLTEAYWVELEERLVSMLQFLMPDYEGLTSVREVAWLLKIGVYLLGFFGARALALMAWRPVSDQRSEDLRQWLIFLAFGSFLMGWSIRMDYQAQEYLMFPIQIPISVLAALGAWRLFQCSKKSHWGKLALFLFVLMGLNQAQLTSKSLVDPGYFVGTRRRVTDDVPMFLEFKKALYWIRDNRPLNEIVLSNMSSTVLLTDHNRVKAPNPTRYFWVSALAERRSFLAGYAYWPKIDYRPRMNQIDRFFFNADRSVLDEIEATLSRPLILLDKRWPPYNIDREKLDLVTLFENSAAAVLLPKQ